MADSHGRANRTDAPQRVSIPLPPTFMRGASETTTLKIKHLVELFFREPWCEIFFIYMFLYACSIALMCIIKPPPIIMVMSIMNLVFMPYKITFIIVTFTAIKIEHLQKIVNETLSPGIITVSFSIAIQLLWYGIVMITDAVAFQLAEEKSSELINSI